MKRDEETILRQRNATGKNRPEWCDPGLNICIIGSLVFCTALCILCSQSGDVDDKEGIIVNQEDLDNVGSEAEFILDPVLTKLTFWIIFILVFYNKIRNITSFTA